MDLVLQKLSKIERKLNQPEWTEQQIRTATTIDDYSPYAEEHGKIYSDYLTDMNDGYDPYN